ncbi:MAG TPA: hypothetical protein DEA22_14180 [Blastocatellia bacterium]|nr:hypothetical protein [Blastocatellia bacterium]
MRRWVLPDVIESFPNGEVFYKTDIDDFPIDNFSAVSICVPSRRYFVLPSRVLNRFLAHVWGALLQSEKFC